MSGIDIHHDYLEFFLTIIAELEKGWRRALIDHNQVTVGHSLQNLRTFQSMLSAVEDITTDLDLRGLLQELSHLIQNFLNDCGNYEAPNTNPEYISVPQYELLEASSSGGRRKFSIPASVITKCRSAGMTWKRCAEFIGVSRSALYNHKSQFPQELQMNDNELEETVKKLKQENRSCGEKYVAGYLLSKGVKVTRKRIRSTLKVVDPVGTVFRRKLKTKRGKYSVKGPNYVWNMDANEKLQAFGLYIHGCSDGFSRKCIYLRCSSNKKASTVLNYFRDSVRRYGFPKTVRSDKGRENMKVANYVFKNRGTGSYCFITGKSVHNVRIERFWGEVNKYTLRYKKGLRKLQDQGFLDVGNALHLFSVAYIFIPRIERSLNQFQNQWNCHKIRTAANRTPNELYLTATAAKVMLVVTDSDTSCESEEDSDSNEDSIIYQYFLEVAQQLVPDPLIDDGSDGIDLLKGLLNKVDDISFDVL